MPSSRARSRQIEAFKYRAIDAIRPKALILGNSRAEMGWNPELVNRAGLGPTVNAAIPGRGLDAMAPLADYAWHVSRPATLIVGAEFFDCLVSGAAPAAEVAPAASPWALPAAGFGGRVARMRLFIPDLFSFDTLIDSLTTVLSQRNPVAAHLRADGFQTAREYLGYLRVDGPRKMFLQRDHDYIARRIDGPKSVRFDGGVPAPCFSELRAILDQATVRKQRVFVATYPFHARLLETISALGLWPAYEDWKAEVVRTVDAARQQGARIELRDFSGFHRYAQDRLPPEGQRVPAPDWYWESGHFKSVLGERMLEIMLGQRPAEGSFGERSAARTSPRMRPRSSRKSSASRPATRNWWRRSADWSQRTRAGLRSSRATGHAPVTSRSRDRSSRRPPTDNGGLSRRRPSADRDLRTDGGIVLLPGPVWGGGLVCVTLSSGGAIDIAALFARAASSRLTYAKPEFARRWRAKSSPICHPKSPTRRSRWSSNSRSRPRP